MEVRAVKKILVYRLGSLGDTLLALPALHALRREYRSARIVLLTNRPVVTKAAPMMEVLAHTGLIDEHLDYPVGVRNWRALLALRDTLLERRFDLMVNLAAPRGFWRSLRDMLFFKSCGVRHVIGTPWLESTRAVRLPGTEMHEWEAHRIARRLSDLFSVDIDSHSSWDLRLTSEELAVSERYAPGPLRNWVISVGTKVSAKDWTQANWESLIRVLAPKYSMIRLIAIGSADEASRSEACLGLWNGPTANLCGRLSVRETAAVLSKSDLFVGHDSGPMHLAATVGTPCVAIFAARNLPGQWYPRGKRNRVLYRRTECYGCELDVCHIQRKKCILDISVATVADAIESLSKAILREVHSDSKK